MHNSPGLLSLSSPSNSRDAAFSLEVERLLHQMDEDRDGCVSFDEFTRYMAAVSLIDAAPIPAAPIPASPTPTPSPPAVQT